MYVSPKIHLVEENGFRSLIADAIFEPDELILEFERSFVTTPNQFSLQVDENLHQLSNDSDALENFVNHSCQPNGYIDFGTLSLKARRRIEVGEVLNFNYFTTDYHSDDVFYCQCGSLNCKKIVNGFKNLSFQEMKELEPYLSPFLKQKMYEMVYAPSQKSCFKN